MSTGKKKDEPPTCPRCGSSKIATIRSQSWTHEVCMCGNCDFFWDADLPELPADRRKKLRHDDV